MYNYRRSVCRLRGRRVLLFSDITKNWWTSDNIQCNMSEIDYNRSNYVPLIKLPGLSSLIGRSISCSIIRLYCSADSMVSFTDLYEFPGGKMIAMKPSDQGYQINVKWMLNISHLRKKLIFTCSVMILGLVDNFSLTSINLPCIQAASPYWLPSVHLARQMIEFGPSFWAPFLNFPDTLLSARLTFSVIWKHTLEMVFFSTSIGCLGAKVTTPIL